MTSGGQGTGRGPSGKAKESDVEWERHADGKENKEVGETTAETKAGVVVVEREQSCLASRSMVEVSGEVPLFCCVLCVLCVREVFL